MGAHRPIDGGEVAWASCPCPRAWLKPTGRCRRHGGQPNVTSMADATAQWGPAGPVWRDRQTDLRFHGRRKSPRRHGWSTGRVGEFCGCQGLAEHDAAEREVRPGPPPAACGSEHAAVEHQLLAIYPVGDRPANDRVSSRSSTMSGTKENSISVRAAETPCTSCNHMSERLVSSLSSKTMRRSRTSVSAKASACSSPGHSFQGDGAFGFAQDEARDQALPARKHQRLRIEQRQAVAIEGLHGKRFEAHKWKFRLLRQQGPTGRRW